MSCDLCFIKIISIYKKNIQSHLTMPHSQTHWPRVRRRQETLTLSWYGWFVQT
jgi:hypothetical protein